MIIEERLIHVYLFVCDHFPALSPMISSFSKEIRQLLDGMAQNHEIVTNSIEPISMFYTDEIRYAFE